MERRKASGIILGIALMFPGLFLSSILFFHLLCSGELRPGLVVAAGAFYIFVAFICSLFWKYFREALSGDSL